MRRGAATPVQEQPGALGLVFAVIGVLGVFGVTVTACTEPGDLATVSAIFYGRVVDTTSAPLADARIQVLLHRAPDCDDQPFDSLLAVAALNGTYRAVMFAGPSSGLACTKVRFGAIGFRPDSVLRQDVVFVPGTPTDSIETNAMLKPSP